MSSLTARPVPKQQQQKSAVAVPVVSTSIGASVDSFYRSAMNSWLNARLTGKQGALFPKMHIQTPIRIIYINGIKNLRVLLERERKDLIEGSSSGGSTSRWKGREWVLGSVFAIIPGLAMTPFSSILEASNAGHMNAEALSVRWMRGLIPRTVREIIFATGLNQLSDVCEGHAPASIQNPALKNVYGSIVAGVVSGYLSHVPHNLSTLKLLKPTVSYGEHFRALAMKYGNTGGGTSASSGRLPQRIDYLKVFLLPKGVMIRTGQIVGSFVLVNGTIALFSTYRLEEALMARAYGSVPK